MRKCPKLRECCKHSMGRPAYSGRLSGLLVALSFGRVDRRGAHQEVGSGAFERLHEHFARRLADARALVAERPALLLLLRSTRNIDV